jgi:hypothetical protein
MDEIGEFGERGEAKFSTAPSHGPIFKHGKLFHQCDILDTVRGGLDRMPTCQHYPGSTTLLQIKGFDAQY